MTDFSNEFAYSIIPQKMSEARISIDDFIASFNSSKAELIDVRTPAETAVWQLNFGLKIPANELPERLDQLPKDKLLIVACPMTDRSNMARSYLLSKGFKVKYLQGGLLSLMDHLKGVNAENIRI